MGTDDNSHETHGKKRSEVSERVTNEILECDELVLEALKHKDISSVEDKLSLSDDETSHLSYIIKNNDETKTLPFYIRCNIRILHAWNFYLLEELDIKNIDWLDEGIVSIDDFDTFRVSSYDPNSPVKQSMKHT